MGDFKKKFYNINPQQKIFIEEYFVKGNTPGKAAMLAGYSDDPIIATTAGHRLLRSPTVRWYLQKCGIKPETNKGVWNYTKKMAEEADKLHLEEERQVIANANKLVDMFTWKTEKLKQIIEVNVPGQQTNTVDYNDNGQVVQQNSGRYNYGAAIAAISELNKMQGHYAATKTVNVDLKVDADMRKLKELSDKLLIEYKKEIMDEKGELY